MPDFVCHIGYPKCASGFLQRSIWPANFRHQLRKRPSAPPLGWLGKRIERSINTRPPRFWDSAPGQALAADLAAQIGDDAAVLPEEKLLKCFLFLGFQRLRLPRHKLFESDGGFTVARHLGRLAAGAWADKGAVRAVLVVRRQPEFLASQYAQHANRLPGTQADFERRIRRLLDKGLAGPMAYLDYGRLVAELQDALGAAHVHVMAFEDIQAGRLAGALAPLLGPDAAIPEAAGRTNVRSRSDAGGGREWALRSRQRPFDPGEAIAWRPYPRDAAIHIPAELDRAVMDLVAPSNRRLAAALGRSDLGELGYFA